MTAPRAQEPLPDDLMAKIEKLCDEIDSRKWGASMMERHIVDLCLEARRAPSADTRRLVATAFTEGAKWDARNSRLSYYGWHDAMNIAAKKYADAAMTQEGE